MFNKVVRRAIAIMMTASLMIMPSQYIGSSAVAAESIDGEYIGREQGLNLIRNVNFSDISTSHWAKEPVSRLGALDIIKGDNNGRFAPNNTVTNEEAIAFVMRVIATEEEAQLAAEALENEHNLGGSVKTIWSRGYLALASEFGLITEGQLRAVVQPDGVNTETFNRTGAASREQVAEWLVKAINIVKPDLIQPIYNQQGIYNFRDWQNMDPLKIPYIEAAIVKQLMVGNNNQFRPKERVTRAEMAQILVNAGDILYSTKGVTYKTGRVERIEDTNVFGRTDIAHRKFFIRSNEGGIDVLTYEYKAGNNLVATKDIPTYINGTVGSLLTLEKGMLISYITDNQSNEGLYVAVNGTAVESKVQGILQPLTELTLGNLTIRDNQNNTFTYKLSRDMYIPEENKLKIGNVYYPMDRLPVGTNLVLTLANKVVVEIEFYAPAETGELNGTVKEVNKNLGYIAIVDFKTGKEVVKSFDRDSVSVKKQSYYDNSEDMSYIEFMFDIPAYDSKGATIDDIEVGDIVYLKLHTDGERITNISAKTNYVVKYGTLTRISAGNNKQDLVFTTEDGQIFNYTINNDVPVKKGGSRVAASTLRTGDWVKLLVNQAVIGTGQINEQVKEVVIDNYSNIISSVYKGQLGQYNKNQRLITLNNGYTLERLGWDDYTESRQLKIGNSPIEVYYKNKRLSSIEEAMTLYKGSAYTVLVAMEGYYDQERICKITITDERVSTPTFDTVTSSSYNRFSLFNTRGSVNTNPGTIIIRDGRLVSGENIMAPDTAQVVLGGASTAAVVNITNNTKNAGVTVSRGRIKNIADNQSFTVSSQGMLRGMEWIYSPIERVYTVDYQTLIINSEGAIVKLSDFKTYGQNTQYEEVFTIISEGTHAKVLVQGPYATRGAEGTVFEVTDNKLSIRDVQVYNQSSKTFSILSNKNNYAEVIVEPTTIILKNDQRITPDEIAKGDKIRVLTTEDLANKLKLDNSREISGAIILVE